MTNRIVKAEPTPRGRAASGWRSGRIRRRRRPKREYFLPGLTPRPSWPGLTRPSIVSRPRFVMGARVKPARDESVAVEKKLKIPLRRFLGAGGRALRGARVNGR